jgi:hypothetical protein
MTGPQHTTKTWVEHRIESLRPGRKRWQFVPFTGAGPRRGDDGLEALTVQMAGCQEDSGPKGWIFRITSRTVTQTRDETTWR